MNTHTHKRKEKKEQRSEVNVERRNKAKHTLKGGEENKSVFFFLVRVRVSSVYDMI